MSKTPILPASLASALLLHAQPPGLHAYVVPEDAVPLSAPAPSPPPIPSFPKTPSPVRPPQISPPAPAPPPVPTAREVALSGVTHSPRDYFVLADQSVYTPRPIGMVPFRQASGSSCPLPRYSAPGVVAFGWSASGSPPSEFEDCGDRIRSLAFFLSPSSRRGRALEGLTRSQYEGWLEGVTEEDARNLGNLVASAMARALGAGSHSLVESRPSSSRSMPGVSGSVRLASPRGRERTLEFSALVTASGRGDFSTWAVCVVASDPSRPVPAPSSLAAALARAFYYLNRDFNAKTTPPLRQEGPFAPRTVR